MSSVETDERTEQSLEDEPEDKHETQGEKNAELHSTPTENGSDHPVPSTGESQYINDCFKYFFGARRNKIQR